MEKFLTLMADLDDNSQKIMLIKRGFDVVKGG